MKIGINTLFMIPYEVGGTETYLREIMKAMVPAFSRHHFVIFTNAENDSVLRQDLKSSANVDFVQINFSASRRSERVIREQFQLPFLVRKAGVDVLWSPGNAAPLVVGCPQVVTIHDMQYKSHPDDLNFIEHCVIDFLVQWSVRICARVLTPSEFSKQEVIRHTAAKPEKVHAIASGVHPRFASDIPSQERRGGVLAGVEGLRRPYLLCVSNSYPHKNLDALAGACVRLEKIIPHQLVLVGKARRGDRALSDELSRFEDRHRVLRLQGIESSVLAALYQEADCVVFPSLYEGFGLPVLEAMLAGIPVVTTRCGSIPEVGGESVFYARSTDAVGLADAIQHVLGMSPDARARHIQQAQAHASTFTWDRTALAVMGVIEGTAGSRG